MCWVLGVECSVLMKCFCGRSVLMCRVLGVEC